MYGGVTFPRILGMGVRVLKFLDVKFPSGGGGGGGGSGEHNILEYLEWGVPKFLRCQISCDTGVTGFYLGF